MNYPTIDQYQCYHKYQNYLRKDNKNKIKCIFNKK